MLAMKNTKEVDKFEWVDWMVAERKRQGLSQADIARLTGLSRAAVSSYEKRERANPEIDALVRISRALGYGDLYLPRLANLIPSEAEINPEIEAIADEASKLDDQDKAEVLAYIRMKININKSKRRMYSARV